METARTEEGLCRVWSRRSAVLQVFNTRWTAGCSDRLTNPSQLGESPVMRLCMDVIAE